MSAGADGHDPKPPEVPKSDTPAKPPVGPVPNGSFDFDDDGESSEEEKVVEEIELPPASEGASRKPELGRPTFEDGARKTIALLLIWILAGLLLAAYLTTWILPHYTGNDAAAAAKVREDVSFILQQAVGPLITLIGTVCGFYFGGRKRGE
jgi:hypothetical protein